MNNIALHLYMVNNTVYEVDHSSSITATVNECCNWYILNVLMK